MKPGFALSLSFQGITLLHRAADGWRSVGEVLLDVPNLSDALSDLRAKAYALNPDNPACKIIIPNDQIRYITIDTGSFEGQAREEMARAALEGATPYDVSDLAIDLCFDGHRTHIAAVARETLDEAETFALEHGFEPVSFVATPDTDGYDQEPFFGLTRSVDPNMEIEPDSNPVKMIGPAVFPDSPPALEPREPETPPEPKQAPEPPTDTTPEPSIEPERKAPPEPKITQPVTPDPPGVVAQEAPPEPPLPAKVTSTPKSTSAGFASRRGKPADSGDAPSLSGASRDAATPAGAARLHLSPVAQPAGPKPTAPSARSVSVAAPSLDLPDDPVDPVDEPTADRQVPLPASNPPAPKDNARTRFLSDRKSDAPDAGPHRTDAKVIIPSRPSLDAPKDETERMTVFGARNRQQVGGKPRHLGLILTLGLLVFLAAVAAWAAIFLEDGVSGLLAPDAPKDSVVAAIPQTPSVEGTPAAPTPQAIAEKGRSALPAPTRIPAPEPAETIADRPLPDLTDTDAAVLQAMGTTEGSKPPSLQQEDARYAATGIWQNAPHTLPAPEPLDLENLYEVSIDRRDLSQDAVALPPSAGFDTDQPPESISSPAAAGIAFSLDEQGLVTPTPQGTLNPDGILIHLGRPPVSPPPTPVRFEVEPEGEAEALQDRLAGLQPRPRPTDLVEQNERSRLGGLSREELGRVRPKTRPRAAKQEAEADETPTAQAVAASRRPDARPKNFAAKVQKVKQNQASPSARAASLVPAAPRTVTPKIPSSASVSRRATLDNAINLNRINLIGVYGTPANRRALVRLPSGRYKKVKVGDNVDGGRILAIGDSELRYQKGGRNLTLKIPRG